MSWGEAIRALGVLRKDSTSQFAAAMEGWDYPIDRASLLLADLYDLQHITKADPKKGKPKPHPGRPWKISDREVTRHGNAAGRSPDEVKALLRRMARGDDAPV
jgi:hypothetical protein